VPEITKPFLLMIPTLWALAAAACSASETTRQDKPARAAARSSRVDESIVPSLGAGIRTISALSPMAITRIRDVTYVAGMGKLSTLRAESLAEFARVDTRGPAWDLAILEEKLFVAEGRSGLTEFSISSTGEPTFAQNYSLPGDCKRIVSSKSAVAALCTSQRLVIVRPGNPPEIISLPGEPMDAVWHADSLYIASPGNGLITWHPADPHRPRIDYQDKLDRILSVTVVDSRLFVGLRDKTVVEIDLITGRRKAEIAVLNRPMRLIAGSKQLLVASTWLGDPGATLVDVSNPGQLRIANRWPFSVATGTMLDSGKWLVTRPEGNSLIVQSDGKEIQNLRGARFERVARTSAQGLSWEEERAASWMWQTANPEALFSARKLADVTACGDALCTLEPTGRVCRQGVADAEPDCLDIPNGGCSLAWQISTETLWVIDSRGEVHGIRWGKPGREISSLPRVDTTAPQNYARFVIDGNRAVAIDIDFAALQVFDLGSSPRLRGRYLLHSLPRAVALVGDLAFVAEPAAGVQVIDISAPDAPREIGWHPMDVGPLGIAARRDETGRTFVVLAEGERGISAWQWLSNARKLEKIRQSDTQGLASDVIFFGLDLVVADWSSILQFSGTELFR